MSLTFVMKTNENLNQQEINVMCQKIWNLKAETAIKLFFFIRDKDMGKNQSKAFRKIMYWLFNNKPSVFYKVFSLIVGIPNSHTLKQETIKNMLKKDWEKHESVLKNYIEPEYQKTFRDSWYSTANDALLKAYQIPSYGTFEDLIAISKMINMKKIFFIVINIFSNQIKKDLRNNIYSEALEIIEKYPKYKKTIEEIIPHNLKNNNTQPKKTIKNIGTYSNFLERYAFVNI